MERQAAGADRRIGDVQRRGADRIDAVAGPGNVDGAAVRRVEAGRRGGVDVEAAGERDGGAGGLLVVVVEIDAEAASVDGTREIDDAPAANASALTGHVH